MSILDRDIIFVTGKGGVGKTTAAAALGLWAARMGKKVIIAETAGAEHAPGLFGKQGKGYAPTELSDGLWSLSITPEAAIEEYIVQQVKVRKIYELVFRNRVMGPFLDAVPGLHDAVQVGKVFDLQRETTTWGRRKWDLVIVDAPATGHGLTLMAAARSMMELTRKGPLFESNKLVDEVVSDPLRTAILLVCLPEAMPVNETLELVRRLGPGERRLAACLLNQVLPRLMEHPEDLTVARPSLERSPDPSVREALSLAEDWQARVARQELARQELEGSLPIPVLPLGHCLKGRLEAEDLVALSRELERGLQAGVAP